jgi:hypothetical protein
VDGDGFWSLIASLRAKNSVSCLLDKEGAGRSIWIESLASMVRQEAWKATCRVRGRESARLKHGMYRTRAPHLTLDRYHFTPHFYHEGAQSVS